MWVYPLLDKSKFEAGPNKKDQDEAKEVAALEMHNSHLHDQNEDEGDNLIDASTGKPFDNSTYTGTENFSVIKVKKGSDDILGALPEKDDEAARWLRAEEERRRGDDFKKAA